MAPGKNNSVLTINTKGFTLVELLVTISLGAIIVAIATPSFIQWRQNMELRQDARGVVAILRDARNRSISNNVQYRVEIDTVNRRYGMRRGTLPSGTNWDPGLPSVPAAAAAVANWTAFRQRINLSDVNNLGAATALPTTVAGTFAVEFNPNGTSTVPVGTVGPAIITVLDLANAGVRSRFRIDVFASGRIRMRDNALPADP